MEVKYYLPKFDSGNTTINDKDAEMELFQKLYNEKTTHMEQVRALLRSPRRGQDLAAESYI